jgi:hypothetical protein
MSMPLAAVGNRLGTMPQVKTVSVALNNFYRALKTAHPMV